MLLPKITNSYLYNKCCCCKKTKQKKTKQKKQNKTKKTVVLRRFGSLKCAVNTRVGVEWEQPLLTKCPNGYAPHTASDSKVLSLPSRGGTVSTNGERRKARHWRFNQLLWTDGVHQLKRQFI